MKKVQLHMYLKQNLGDDLFLKIILERYPNTMFYLLSDKNYKHTFFKKYNHVKLYHKIPNKIVNLWYWITRKQKKMFHDIKKKCDYMITLGGSMFIEKGQTEEELKRELDDLYYKEYKPYYIIGSNFGPYYHAYYKNRYDEIVKRAEAVHFREEYSYQLFQNIKHVYYDPDIVFSLKESITISKKREVSISVMNLQKEAYFLKIVEIIHYFQKQNYQINLISFCKYEGDEKAIRKIMKQLDHKEGIKNYYYRGDIDSIIRVIAKSEIVVATRFHACILGLLFEKKVLPIAYSPKTLNALKDLKYQGTIIDIDEIESFSIDDLTENDWNDKLDISQVIKKSENHFKELDQVLR